MKKRIIPYKVTTIVTNHTNRMRRIILCFWLFISFIYTVNIINNKCRSYQIFNFLKSRIKILKDIVNNKYDMNKKSKKISEKVIFTEGRINIPQTSSESFLFPSFSFKTVSKSCLNHVIVIKMKHRCWKQNNQALSS